jgi:hypothetical protein
VVLAPIHNFKIISLPCPGVSRTTKHDGIVAINISRLSMMKHCSLFGNLFEGASTQPSIGRPMFCSLERLPRKSCHVYCSAKGPERGTCNVFCFALGLAAVQCATCHLQPFGLQPYSLQLATLQPCNLRPCSLPACNLQPCSCNLRALGLGRRQWPKASKSKLSPGPRARFRP